MAVINCIYYLHTRVDVYMERHGEHSLPGWSGKSVLVVPPLLCIVLSFVTQLNILQNRYVPNPANTGKEESSERVRKESQDEFFPIHLQETTIMITMCLPYNIQLNLCELRH